MEDTTTNNNKVEKNNAMVALAVLLQRMDIRGNHFLRLQFNGDWLEHCFAFYQVNMDDIGQCIRSVAGTIELNICRPSPLAEMEIRIAHHDISLWVAHLTKVRKAIQEASEALVCQVSSMIWPTTYYNRELLFADLLIRSSEHLASDPINWELFQSRLEKYPDEAAYPEIVSSTYGYNQETGGNEILTYPSILHALCCEDACGVRPIDIPLAVMESLIQAYPKAASIKAAHFHGAMPLHLALNGIAAGWSSLRELHIQALMAAYPEAVSCSVDCEGFEIFPIQIICALESMYSRDRKTRLPMSVYVDYSKTTLQACVELIVPKTSHALLLEMASNPEHKYCHPLKMLCRVAIWRGSIITAYMAVLHATTAANNELGGTVEERLLHVALKPEHGGSLAVMYLFEDLLKVIDPAALKKRNSEGLLPLHVAIRHARSLCRGPDCTKYFSACVEPLLQAEPRALKAREPQNALYPYEFAAVGEKSQPSIVYALLRRDPALLVSRVNPRSVEDENESKSSEGQRDE